MKNIKKNLNYLKVLATPGDISKSIIKSANKELIAAICECVQNVCNGNVKIDCKMHNKLKCHKNVLRNIQKKSTLNTKRKLLIQQGGSIYKYIIPSVLSLSSKLL